MRKYILFSFIPAGSGTPVHVPVPYVSDTQQATLISLLCKSERLSEVETEYLNAIYETKPMEKIIDLSLFTHLISQY